MTNKYEIYEEEYDYSYEDYEMYNDWINDYRAYKYGGLKEADEYESNL